MRRTLTAITVTLVLLAGIFLLFFSLSPFNVRGQSYLQSLDDFVFLLDCNRRHFFQTLPPPLTADSYRATMAHVSPKAHHEIDRAVLWLLEQWGDEVRPFLVDELQTATPDRYRINVIAKAIARRPSPDGIAAIAQILDQIDDDPRDVPMLRQFLVEALGESQHPDAVPVLARYLEKAPPNRSLVFEALARTGGTELLLDEFDRAPTREERFRLIWALAISRDGRAMQRIAPLLLDFDAATRVRARSAMDQSARETAVDAVLDVLENTGDEYVLSDGIQSILANRYAAGNPRVVPFLRRFIEHPALAWEANYALARVGSREAIDALAEAFQSMEPRTAMKNLEYLGARGLPLLQRCLHHPDPYVRREGIHKLMELLQPDVRPLLQPLTADPDRWVRRDARVALLQVDKIDLLESLIDRLPEHMQLAVWHGFRGDWKWGFSEGFAASLTIFTVVHLVGTGLSLLLALLLLLNLLRVFEPFRFNLFIQFLLVEGFLGDFFFLDSGVDFPWLLYQGATAVHLLLLIAFLCQERDPVPGELASRFERLGGASLWLLTPPLLALGTPVWAEGLRLVMRDFGYVQFLIGLLAFLAILVIEQWALPRRLFPRADRLERLFSGCCSAGVLALTGWPVLLLADRHRSQGAADEATLCLLLLAPPAWFLALHLSRLGLFRPLAERIALPPAPSRRLAAHSTANRITVRLLNRRLRWLSLPLQGGWIVAAGCTAAYFAARFSGGGQGLVMAVLVGPLGAAVAALTLDLFRPVPLIQFEAGFMRSAATVLGGSFGRAPWVRKAVFSVAVRRRLQPREEGAPLLNPDERAWFGRLLGSTRPGDRSVAAFPADMLEISGAASWIGSEPENGLRIDLQVANRHSEPVTLAELERGVGRLLWRAELDGKRADLFLSRTSREMPLPPDRQERLVARLFPTGRCEAGGTARIECDQFGRAVIPIPPLPEKIL